MADAERDSDLGDDSPVSARSDTSGEHDSYGSTDEGVGRDPTDIRNNTSPQTQKHNTIKIRDDFESLKSSLHPHLSSLASLAQGAPLSAAMPQGPSAPFSLPMGFPFQNPSAFLPPPAPPAPQPTQQGCSSSSSSSEGSNSWSFEEQYKQVRQLYEISDEPQRKEFLDDLFSFMQKRGTPINRLPIMAKSVLDLYELYNLVIARGGLVEVINKKLWQEIIKGLRLPSSITSAAFTLRTQYMKYLYDYECDKKNLSTRSELDAAIEGNKREGRRASGQYEAQAAMAMNALQPGLGRGVPVSAHMQPLTLPGVPRLPTQHHHELEYRVREYMKLIQQHHSEYRNSSESPPSAGASPRDSLSALDVSRLTLWSLYNNNTTQSHPALRSDHTEPQREALNLSELSVGVKRECESPLPNSKRRTPSGPPSSGPPLTPHSATHTPHTPTASLSPPEPQRTPPHVNGTDNTNSHGANFKITTRGDISTGDQQLVVSIELNGVTYEGVLFPSSRTHQHRAPMVT